MKANLKAISLGGFVALSLFAASVSLVKPAQAERGQPGHRLEQLNLSADQSAQIEAIHANSRSQIEAVLTPEQRTAIANSDSPRELTREAMRSLDLTDEQRSQIKAIHDSTRTEINAVLTTEQQQQLAAMPKGGPEGRGGGHGGERGPRLENLNLTDAQSAEIEAIRTAARSQAEAVLTPEQRTAVANSDSPREAMRSLNLTDAQRQQLRTIHEDSHQKIDAVLTDEQRQQLPQRPERPENRPNRPSQPPTN